MFHLIGLLQDVIEKYSILLQYTVCGNQKSHCSSVTKGCYQIMGENCVSKHRGCSMLDEGFVHIGKGTMDCGYVQ